MSRVVVGTRESALALWQTHWVIGELKQRHPEVEFDVRGIRTLGDLIRNEPLTRLGDKGVFVREIEAALSAGEIDFAVHSLKDLPSEQPEELTIGAITTREDVRDAFVSRHGGRLLRLPAGARIGTSSLRRAAQILHRRPDFTVVNLRGNVDTRLRKAESDEHDGIVLAVAGLVRLARTDAIAEILPVELMLPAVGQGALAIEMRAGDERIAELLAPLDDAATRAGTTAERALLADLGGGCAVPIAAYGRVAGDSLHLDGLVASPDGKDLLHLAEHGPAADPTAIGRRLADRLRAAGADRILEAFREQQERL